MKHVRMKPFKVVSIPETMEKFYGRGSMLHPEMEHVRNTVQEIPLGQLVTLASLCEKLAADANTSVACPMRTGNAIKRLAESDLDPSSSPVDVPFWRVIRKDHFVIKSKAIDRSAALLEQEGFQLSYTGNGSIKVIFDSEYSFL